MKLSISKDKFLKAIQKVINIIGNRSTLPVLGNVLLEAEGNALTLTTTDLEIRITTRLEAAVEKSGRTTVPAKKLHALVSRFIGDSVCIACND